MSTLLSGTVHRKTSSSGDVTLYVGKRDYYDHFSHLEPLDGVIVTAPNAAYGRRLYVQILLHFRYGAESDEFTNVSFKKTACIASCELFSDDVRDGSSYSPWQAGILKKVGQLSDVYPFSIPLPQGLPPSIMMYRPPGVGGEPCGISYEIVTFLGHSAEQPLSNKQCVKMRFRILQNTSLVPQMESSVAVRPATMVNRQFFLSPGRLQVEMCLDKTIAYFGDKILMNVSISNNTNKTVKKIKCKIMQCSQMSFATGERKIAIFGFESQDGCPIMPGATLQKTYSLLTALQPHRRRDGLGYEAALHGLPEKLAPSSVFPNTDPREGFAIIVSYVAKIKLCVGVVNGDVSAEVPFLVFHRPEPGKLLTGRKEINPEMQLESKITRNPMIRLVSLEESSAEPFGSEVFSTA